VDQDGERRPVAPLRVADQLGLLGQEFVAILRHVVWAPRTTGPVRRRPPQPGRPGLPRPAGARSYVPRGPVLPQYNWSRCRVLAPPAKSGPGRAPTNGPYFIAAA